MEVSVVAAVGFGVDSYAAVGVGDDDAEVDGSAVAGLAVVGAVVEVFAEDYAFAGFHVEVFDGGVEVGVVGVFGDEVFAALLADFD